MTLLYLIRHGRSLWNADGRIQGHADIPLDDVGHWQARALAERLKPERIEALYSSPLRRAQETAEHIAAALQLPIIYDDRLKERDTGEWTGLTGGEVEAIMAAHPEKKWHFGNPPGGETTAQVIERVLSFSDELLARPPGQRIALVSHGGTLNAYLRHLLGIGPERHVHFRFGNTGLARVALDNGHVRLLSIGDDRHLEGLNE